MRFHSHVATHAILKTRLVFCTPGTLYGLLPRITTIDALSALLIIALSTCPFRQFSFL